MPRASRDGVGLAYEVDPVASGADEREEAADRAPIVFVGGVELGRWAWRWQREAFRGRRRVIVPFLRGTGPRARADGGLSVPAENRRSDGGLAPVLPSLPGRLRRPLIARGAGYTVATLADDLEAVLSDDGGRGPRFPRDVHLVGQGLGGAIAIEAARESDRVRSLALVGTRDGGDETPATPDAARSQALDPAGSSDRERRRNRLRPFFADAFVARNPHLLERLLVWQADADPAAATREAQWTAWEGYDPRTHLEDVDVPSLVLHGTADRLVPVENGHALAEALPEGSIELIEGGGHLVGVEAPERVNERLRAFVRSTEEAV